MRNMPGVLPPPPVPFFWQTVSMDIPGAGRRPPPGGGRGLSRGLASRHWLFEGSSPITFMYILRTAFQRKVRGEWDAKNAKNSQRKWFFGGLSGTTFVMTRMQRARRVTGHVPIRGGHDGQKPACGWFMRNMSGVLPPPPVPFSWQTVSMGIPGAGRHPPPGGGRGLSRGFHPRMGYGLMVG